MTDNRERGRRAAPGKGEMDKSGTWYERWLNAPAGQWWNASDESDEDDLGHEADFPGEEVEKDW